MTSHPLKNFWAKLSGSFKKITAGKIASCGIKLDKILGLLVTVSVFCLIFVLSHRAVFDLDIWLHLKSGEFILQNKTIPSCDIFSFTFQGRPWIDHEWLFQVISYLIYNKLQAEALITFQCYIIILSFLVLFIMGYKQIKSYMEAAVFIFMAAYACVGRFNIRPDIFSMLFFSLFLYLLRFNIGKKIIWLLVPVQALWVNFHGYFFLGPLVTLLFILAELIRRKVKFLPRQWKQEFALDDAAYKRLKIVFFFIVFACFLNPQGLAGAFYPFSVFKEILSGRTQLFFKYIQELRPTFGGNSYLGNLYYLLIIFCFSLVAINFKRLKLIEVFLVVFFFLFALTVRNVAFFAFVGYLIIISYMVPALRSISTKIRLEIRAPGAFYFLLKWGLAIFLMAWIWLRINSILGDGYYDFEKNKFVSLVSGIEERRYPKAAVDFVLNNNINATLFNDFNSGAYLIGRAYPKIKVFIDGRTELYGFDFFKQYQEMMRAKAQAFETITSKYNITAILLSLTSDSLPEIISCVYTNPQWKMVFFSETGLVFLKDIPVNKGLIDRYKVDFNKYHTPLADLQALGLRKAYPSAYIKRASLFNLLREDALVIQEAKEALRIMPNCAKAFHLLGKVYLRQGQYKEALENLRAALLFVPDNAEALVDLGSSLRGLKDDKASLRVLESVIRRNRRYAPAYYELGNVYMMINDYSQAIAVLNKAVKYAPQEALYYFKLGEALSEEGRKSKNNFYIIKARQTIERASQLNIRKGAELTEKLKAY